MGKRKKDAEPPANATEPGLAEVHIHPGSLPIALNSTFSHHNAAHSSTLCQHTLPLTMFSCQAGTQAWFMMLLYATTAAAMVMAFDMDMTAIYQAAVEADPTWAVAECATVFAKVNFCNPASWHKLKDIPARSKQTANAIAKDLI